MFMEIFNLYAPAIAKLLAIAVFGALGILLGGAAMKQNKRRYINLNTQNISTIKKHKLTQEQYDRELATGNIDPLAMLLSQKQKAVL